MVDTIPLDELEGPHEFNLEILPSDGPSERFVGDIAKNGIKNPLDIDENNEILDGKERYEAALPLGHIEEAPVRRHEGLSEEEKKILILCLNDYREESYTQKVKTALRYEELVAPYFEARMKAGGEPLGKPLEEIYSLEEEEEMDGAGGQHVLSILTEGPPTEESEKYNTRRAYVADRVGWSPTKLWQAKKVWQAKQGEVDIDDEGIVNRLQEIAEEQIEQLDAGRQSVYGAYQQIEIWKGRLENGYPITWDVLEENLSNLQVFRIEDAYDEYIEGFDGETWDEALETVAHPFIEGDDIFPGRAMTAAYLLEVDDALDLEGSYPGLVERRPRKEVLNERYWEDGLNPLEISIRMGVPAVLVRYWMREMNIPVRFDELKERSKQWLVDRRAVPTSFSENYLHSPEESIYTNGDGDLTDEVDLDETGNPTDSEPSEADATAW